MSDDPENYRNDLWPQFYDQYYGADNAREAPFYLDAAAERSGPLLEIGCGTGALFFKLLAGGSDVHGVDVSASMINKMMQLAPDVLRADLQQRVCQADMQTLELDRQFDQIFVPARTFLHAASLDSQMATLKALRRHLRPGGRLLLNFFVPDLFAVLNAFHQPEEEYFDTFVDPTTDLEFDVFITRRVTDINTQRIDVEWRFALPGGERVCQMALRYVGRDEFILMLRGAGFSEFALFGDASRGAFSARSEEMYWIVSC